MCGGGTVLTFVYLSGYIVFVYVSLTPVMLSVSHSTSAPVLFASIFVDSD